MSNLVLGREYKVLFTGYNAKIVLDEEQKKALEKMEATGHLTVTGDTIKLSSKVKNCDVMVVAVTPGRRPGSRRKY